VRVDRGLRHGDTLRLGDVVLTAYNTPGHTRGATTWVTALVDAGKAYSVVFPDGAGFNPGYRVAKEPSYPGITRDYRNTLHFLENLEPDIWAAAHCEYFDLEGKKKRAATEGVKAWIDPEGYRQFIAGKRRAFEDEVDLEMGVAQRPQAGRTCRTIFVAACAASETRSHIERGPIRAARNQSLCTLTWHGAHACV
jgi:metallo-beta-lactamase class B